MPDITVEEFAKDVGVSVKRIQEQLVEAGLSNKNSEDIITDIEKSQLLSFLRKKHGKDSSDDLKKITLRRKTISELKVPVASQGRSKPRTKTVSIEFRKRRTGRFLQGAPWPLACRFDPRHHCQRTKESSR